MTMYMGDTDPQADTRELADAPVAPIKIPPHSGYGDERICPADAEKAGTCRSTKFHPGVDLVGTKGQSVFAPHDGWILYAGKAKAATKQFPGVFAGYEPNVVLLAHDDVRSSALKRLDALLTPSWSPIGTFGTDQAAAYSLLAHLGELVVRRDMDSRLEDVLDASTKIDNANWRSSVYQHGHFGHVMKFQPGDGRRLAIGELANQQARYVKKGTPLGSINGDCSRGGCFHVHWELRTTPFAPPIATNGTVLPEQVRQRLDPLLWLHDYKGDLGAPDIEENAELPAAEGGGLGVLIFLALLAFAADNRRRR